MFFFVVAPEKTGDIHNTSAGHIIPVANKSSLGGLGLTKKLVNNLATYVIS